MRFTRKVEDLGWSMEEELGRSTAKELGRSLSFPPAGNEHKTKKAAGPRFAHKKCLFLKNTAFICRDTTIQNIFLTGFYLLPLWQALSVGSRDSNSPRGNSPVPREGLRHPPLGVTWAAHLQERFPLGETSAPLERLW